MAALLWEVALGGQGPCKTLGCWDCDSFSNELQVPEGPSTQYLRPFVPNTMRVSILEPESLNVGYLNPLGVEKGLASRATTKGSL